MNSNQPPNETGSRGRQISENTFDANQPPMPEFSSTGGYRTGGYATGGYRGPGISSIPPNTFDYSQYYTQQNYPYSQQTPGTSSSTPNSTPVTPKGNPADTIEEYMAKGTFSSLGYPGSAPPSNNPQSAPPSIPPYPGTSPSNFSYPPSTATSNLYNPYQTQPVSSYNNNPTSVQYGSQPSFGKTSYGQQNYNSDRGSERGGKGRGYQGKRGNVDLSSLPVDAIYVTGLPQTVTEKDLAELFGSIGIIKVDKRSGAKKITIYKEKDTDLPKGDAMIIFEDPSTANAAIEWFNGKEFLGGLLKVELVKRKDPAPGSERGYRGRGRGGDRGRGRGRGGGPSDGGEEWICPS